MDKHNNSLKSIVLYLERFLQSTSEQLKTNSDFFLDLREKANESLKKISLNEFNNITLNVKGSLASISTLNLWKYPKLMDGVHSIWFNENLDFSDVAKSEFLKSLSRGYCSFSWLIKHKEQIKDTPYLDLIINETKTLNSLNIIQSIFDINPWKIINISGYETFLISNVFSQDPFLGVNNMTSSKEKINLTISGQTQWFNKSTKQNTSGSLNAKVLWSIAFKSTDKDINSFLKTTKLKDIDIETLILYKDQSTDSLKNLLLKTGKLSILNKISRAQDSFASINIEDLIINPIKKKHLITQKQNFAKVFSKNFTKFDDEVLMKIFKAIISTQKKTSYNEIKFQCFFPFQLHCFTANGQLIQKEKFERNDFSDRLSTEFDDSTKSLNKLITITQRVNPNFFQENIDIFNELLKMFFRQGNSIVHGVFSENGIFYNETNKLSIENKVALIKNITFNIPSYFGYSYDIYSKYESKGNFETIKFFSDILNSINPSLLKDNINPEFYPYLKTVCTSQEIIEIKNQLDRVELFSKIIKEEKTTNKTVKI